MPWSFVAVPPVQCHKQPLPDLMKFVADQDWYQTIRRCNSHPHETKAVDLHGNTALHLASRFYDVPLDVIQKLLASGNGSGSNTQNEDGATPLHIACSLGCSDEVIEALLDASSIGSCSSSRRLRYRPNCMLTNSGKTPLHYACGSHCGPSLESFRSLVKDSVASGTILWEDSAGNNPLHVLCNRYSERIQNFMVLMGHRRLGDFWDWLGDFWERATLISKAAYYGTVSDDSATTADQQQHKMLHACVGIGSACPEAVVKLAIAAHVEEIYICDQDRNFPLHLAARQIATSKNWVSNDDLHVVASLVYQYPEAARLRNKQGHLPLSLAWNMGTWKWNNEIKFILAAYPKALEYLDISDARFSLILSLLGKCSDDEKWLGMNSISLIYQLLRQRPALTNVA